jgi:hypothetical protein
MPIYSVDGQPVTPAEPPMESADAFMAEIDANNEAQRRAIEIMQHKSDLLAYCNNWFAQAAQWRKQSQEWKWDQWDRESDSIYDPELKAKKQSWQSCVHTGMIASHREVIKSQLFRTLCGQRPMLELRRRYDTLPNDVDQSDNIRDLILRENEKTRVESVINDVLEDATKYGTGHCERYWEEKTEERLVRVPDYAVPDDPQMLAAQAAGQIERQLVGYKDELQPVVAYRGVRVRYLPIRDVFPDPKATEVKGNHIAVRFRMTYGELVAWGNSGFAFADAVETLRDYSGEEKDQDDESAFRADKEISDVTPERSTYGNKLLLKRLYARIPRKWVLLGNVGDKDPEELIPAYVVFHSQALIYVEPSREYDGEPPVQKMDYYKLAGEYYGRGLPEMLKAPQDVINETVNQRMDNVALSMNVGGAIHEAAIVDRNDLVSKPGWFVRISKKFTGYIDNAIKFFNIPDITRAAYTEAFEWERYAQERSSANRVTMGTAGQVKDANQTLGGMELLRQTAGEKFAYICAVIEFNFIKELFIGVWQTLYQHLTPEDVIAAIGPKRAQDFKLESPETVLRDYSYEINGFSTMENKALAQMKLGQIQQLFAQYPWYNAMGTFDRLCKAANFEPSSMKYTPEEMQIMMSAQAILGGQLDPPAPQPQGAPQDNKATQGAPK